MLAKELIEEALEKREDLYLSSIALSREEGDFKKISHEETWK